MILKEINKQKYLIKQEISKLETGLIGEKETAYFIDFKLKDSENCVILHDLRLEIDGLTAQIDHLLIYHEKNMKKFRDIKNSKKYMGNEMLSFICISCGKEQRKGLKTFSTKEVFCNHCKV